MYPTENSPEHPYLNAVVWLYFVARNIAESGPYAEYQLEELDKARKAAGKELGLEAL